MAKQELINKRVLKGTGRLIKDDKGTFVLRIQNKDEVTEYDVVKDFLENMINEIVTIGSEMEEF